MIVEQLYTKCLAQGAYYIENNGEVAIIDPLREVNQYIDMANANNAKIKYIFETHFHADFVSGHVTLAEKTGAKIVYGPNANTSFEAINAKDNQEFKIGNLTIKALHTPGHTLESTTYLLKDKNGKDHAIFTGDTMFLGDVGRPDLAQKLGELTQEDLAGMLFESIQTKIKPLANNVIVYPGHGAGSACGKNMMKETVDTLGNQRKVNYALDNNLTKEDFVKELITGLTPPPKYFPLNVNLNKNGYKPVDEVIKTGVNALNAQEFYNLSKQESVIVLDVRHQLDFVKAHIPNSIFIGLKGDFAPWVGTIIKNVNQKLILVVNKGKETEAVTRLARVGFDNTLGFLQEGIEAWKDAEFETASIQSISANEFKTQLNIESVVFDVRKPSEYNSGHLEQATLTPLDSLDNFIGNYPKNNAFYIHCAGGYRSVIAASLLKRKGIKKPIDVAGGFAAIKKEEIPIACQALSCSK